MVTKKMQKMKKKLNDLQPWLDYFDMMQAYEHNGLLQIESEKHEAHVTQTAIHAMSKGDDPQQQLEYGSIVETVRRLQVYAAFCSTKGVEYMKAPFAIHVVKDTEPHDRIYTLLITHHKSWRTMWLWPDNIEVINYQKTENG